VLIGINFAHLPFILYFQESAINTFKLIFFALNITVFYYLLTTGILKVSVLKKLLVTALIFYITVTIYLIANPFDSSHPQVGLAYPLMWAVFCGAILVERKDRWLSLFLVIGVFVLLLALKRGPIVCLAFTTIGWILLSNLKTLNKKNLIQMLKLTLLIGLGVTALFWFRGELFLERLSDTSGSGRDAAYILLALAFLESDIFELFFGHGSMGVQIYMGEYFGVRDGAEYGLMAHNDWLTLSYDFGLLGVVTFLLFHYSVYRRIRRMRRDDYSKYSKYMAIYVSVFVVSFFSQVLFITSYVFLALFLSLILVENHRQDNTSSKPNGGMN